jgi:hypothetical protein
MGLLGGQFIKVTTIIQKALSLQGFLLKTYLSISIAALVKMKALNHLSPTHSIGKNKIP